MTSEGGLEPPASCFGAASAGLNPGDCLGVGFAAFKASVKLALTSPHGDGE